MTRTPNWFGCVWQLTSLIMIWSCEGITTQTNYSRIMVIGDSVDRYALMDWCQHVNGTLMSDKATITRSASKISMDTLLSKHGNRRKAWEVRLCDVQSKGPRDLVMTFVSNKFGVVRRYLG